MPRATSKVLESDPDYPPITPFFGRAGDRVASRVDVLERAGGDLHQPVGADLIASGNRRDLLPLGNDEGIPVVTVHAALQRIGLLASSQRAANLIAANFIPLP